MATTPSEQPTEQLAAPATTDGEAPTRELRPEAGGDAAPPPRLADGVELIGRYEDSGFKDPPYIARRSDGQVVQLPELLYAVAEELDGRRGDAEIAERVGDRVGRGVSADNVRYLLDEKLRPLGLVALPDGSTPKVEKADPLLALKFRAALVPRWVTRALTTVFYPAFFPPVIAAVLLGVAVFDAWFFFVHGAAQSTRELLYNPVLLLMVLGLVVLATALHEIGHATAARYGGAEPGVMGAGIYIVWPAFYTDVTDAYRLNRAGRLRTDLGGVYFNCIFVLGIAAAYFATGFEPLLVLVVVQHLQILQQFLPFLRLDGYYILSDLTGVPDMFSRIKPTLRSALPGSETDDRVEELKPWVRVVTTVWVVALIPILAFVFGLMIFNAPRMFATAWDSFFVQTDRIRDAADDGRTLGIVAGVIQTIALVLPVVGITYTLTRTAGRVARGAWSWSAGAPVRRFAVAVVTAALASGAAYVLVPNGDYRPIQPGERGTLQGGLEQFVNVSSGRPALTEQRERDLGGIRTERDRRRGVRPEREERPAGSPPGRGEPATTEPEGSGGTPSETTPTQTTGTATEPAATTPAETTTATTATTPTGTTATTPTETTTTTPTTTTTATTDTTATTETTP